MEAEPSPVVWLVKPAGWGLPLLPAPMVISTQGNRSLVQPDGLAVGASRRGAVGLLPHLVEAMHRAGGVAVVGHVRAGELERAVRQCRCVGDARIDSVAGQAGRAGGQQTCSRRPAGRR